MKKYPKMPENARSGRSFLETLKKLLSLIIIQIAIKQTVNSNLMKVIVVFPSPALSSTLTNTPELPQQAPEITGNNLISLFLIC